MYNRSSGGSGLSKDAEAIWGEFTRIALGNVSGRRLSIGNASRGRTYMAKGLMGKWDIPL